MIKITLIDGTSKIGDGFVDRRSNFVRLEIREKVFWIPITQILYVEEIKEEDNGKD